jgi:hypothetical protein
MTGPSPKWRTAFFATALVAVLAVAFLGYSVVDQAVTLDYMSDGYSRTEKDLKTLGDAFPRDRYSKKDIVAVLRKIDPQGFIVETNCTVQLNGLRFQFDSKGRLVGVNTKAESSADYECRS